MRRTLSDFEQLITSSALSASLAFTVSVRIRGNFSDGELRKALHKIGRRHAVLSVRIEREEGGTAWFTSDGVPEPQLRVLTGTEECDWRHVVTDELAIPFDWEFGPFVRYVLLRSDGFSDLIGVFHHAVADGLSGAYVMRDILHHLGFPDDEVVVLPSVEFDLLSENPPDLSEMGILPSPPSPTDAPPETTPKSNPPRFRLLTWSFDGAQTSALLTRTKKEQTTVHGALGAAFMAAFADVYGGDDGWMRQIQSPINLRGRVPDLKGEEVGVFMDIILASADCSPGRNFWDIARDLKESLTRASDPDTMLGMFGMTKALLACTSDMNQLFEMMASQITASYDISLSNLGKLNFPIHYGTLELVSVFGPTFAAIGKDRIVGVCTYRGKIFFTFITQETNLDGATMNEIKNRAVVHLAEAVGW